MTAAALLAGVSFVIFPGPRKSVEAQATNPSMLDPNLAVSTVISGLVTPTSLEFLGDNEMLVTEKNTGKVQHVVGGVIQNTALDLAVNNSSERGLLSITTDPNFDSNHFVYLYWTCSAPHPSDPFFPSVDQCPDPPALGADTDDILAVPLLGNRVDRFVWDGMNLTFDRNLIKLRAFQNDGAPVPPGQGDETQPPAGNHNGGVITFGPDGKLYIIFGDNGRRGQLQNLPSGPTQTGLGPTVPDDQFGGPEPDNAHFTGVVIRLNSDGTTPTDNPYFGAGARIGGQVGANIQKIFAYGIRNSFGMAFDPISGNLWDEENGDDSFDELNLVDRGSNSGWVQIMGPINRISEYKQIETTLGAMNLQQLRWPPSRIADSPGEAIKRLFVIPGSSQGGVGFGPGTGITPGGAYSEPEFSWKFAVAPSAIGFLESDALGAEYDGDLFVGASTPALEGGYIFHFDLTANRRQIAVSDPRLADGVADNTGKFNITESESLLIGRNFGVVTYFETGPNGHLFVVSLSKGAIYEIRRNP